VSGWDAVRRTFLAEPWQDFWIDAFVDPPIGDYLAMEAAARAAVSMPTEATLDELIGTLPALIRAHNMTGRDGEPLEWKAAAMGAKLIKSLTAALKSVQDDEGGAPADPLPKSGRRRSSRRHVSPAGPSRSSTPSGG
jgi:hypothetical protein